jgi:hypothetical protein
MKMTLAIVLVLLSGTAFSQTRPKEFSYIDNRVRSIQGTDPVLLSHKLTSGYTTEMEKVRSIFKWITDNIAYYKKPSPSRRKLKKQASEFFHEADPLDTSALKPLTDRVAEKVLYDRQAVCEGYARLFKSLCDHAGIRSEIITGYARNEPTINQSYFRSNHSWNAVFIDSNWYLLDVTWASGVTIFPTGEFLRYFDEYYFLTPPDKFIKHHFPDDLRWTLLPKWPQIHEFRRAPYVQRSFVKYPIIDYFPLTGLIEAAIGDTVRIELVTSPTERNWDIAPDSTWSEIDLANPQYVFIQPQAISAGRRVQYSYPVVSENMEWIHVMYNNDAVLRYRLKVKKDLARESKSIPE